MIPAAKPIAIDNSLLFSNLEYNPRKVPIPVLSPAKVASAKPI